MTALAAYGFVGLGNMGGPMAANLARSGIELVVFDKAGSAARAPAGTHVARSLADVATQAGTVFLSLPDGAAVLDVLAELATTPDHVTRSVIDLSTVGIEAARTASARAHAAGIAYVDAPVSGGRSGAVDATISVMWAGPAELLDSIRPALEAIAQHVFYVGSEAGQGQALKLLNNFLSATATAATAEALLFGLSQGLDMKTLLEVVNVSTGRSHASADKYVKRVLSGTFDSGFATGLMAKDVRLFSEAVVTAGTPHDIGSTVRALWDAAEAGMPGSDHTEVFRFLRDRRASPVDDVDRAVTDTRLTWLRVPPPDELPPEVHELWQAPLARLGFVPNVLRLYALRPTHLLAWNAHYEELMKGESGLTKAEREMIAVVVSVANECRYCTVAHSAALRKLTRDPALADQIASDHRQAAVGAWMRAALDYALKLTLEPRSMAEPDVQALRDAGWTDEDIFDIAEVTALFNMSNRLASGLGWRPNPEFESLGR